MSAQDVTSEGGPVRKETARHYLEQELYDLVRADPAIFDFLQNGSLDGIWYWDLEKPEHEWMSDRLWQVFGHDPDEMPHLAEAWQHMIHPDDLKLALENFNAHCADPNHPYDQIVRYTHKDGSTVWVRCRGLVIRDDDGKPVRMLGAHTEITDLKRAEESLHETNVELKLTNSDLAQFAYSASHDIQAPVRSLHSLLKILDEENKDQLDDDGRATLALALQSAERVQLLTNSILEFARMTNTRPDFQEVDSQRIAEKLRTDFEQDLAESGVTLQFTDLPKIEAIETPFRQLLQNLISNGIKFRKDADQATETPLVEVTAADQGHQWCFAVRDNGIGVEDQFREKVFAAFQRLHSQSEIAGTGLGLALCRRAIMMHRGDIWMESEPGVGTQVFFTIPKERSNE